MINFCKIDVVLKKIITLKTYINTYINLKI